MVRRLKSDLRHFGEKFPERVVQAITLDGLPADAPELVLSRKLAEYGEVIRARTADLPARQAGNARLGFVGLQQRLLSSIAAFARTLEVHRKGLDHLNGVGSAGAAGAFVRGGAEPEDEPLVLQALVRKTELIREQLGSAGRVIAYRVSDWLEQEGITRPKSQAKEIDEATDKDLWTTAVAEMDDETRARRARQAKDIDDLRETLERSREKVGVDPDEHDFGGPGHWTSRSDGRAGPTEVCCRVYSGNQPRRQAGGQTRSCARTAQCTQSA
jgi:hypothetical protein